jgi:hypothetical protein
MRDDFVAFVWTAGYEALFSLLLFFSKLGRGIF